MTTTSNIEEPAMKTVDLDTLTGPEILTPEGIFLPATHRCDRCGAQAWVEAEVPSTRTVKHVNADVTESVAEQVKETLLFCAHHFGQHEDAVKAKAIRIVDYRPTLIKQEKMGGPAL